MSNYNCRWPEGRLMPEPAFTEVLADDTSAVQTYKMLQAMTKLARTQMLLEARLTSRLEEYEQRLESIESQLGDPRRNVPADQVMQSSRAVKAIALEIEKRTKRMNTQRFTVSCIANLPSPAISCCRPANSSAPRVG